MACTVFWEQFDLSSEIIMSIGHILFCSCCMFLYIRIQLQAKNLVVSVVLCRLMCWNDKNDAELRSEGEVRMKKDEVNPFFFLENMK